MIKAFILSLQFLTRLPINIRVDFNKDTIKKATFFFPFIGMIVGFISYVSYYCFLNIMGGNNGAVEVSAVACVVTMLIVTGGLHIDGLSDTFDGFFSSRDRLRILEIMKDSRVGTFGVCAIIFDILLKYIIIKNLPIDIVAFSVILSCGFGRVSSSMLLSFGKSARGEGLSNMFTNKDSKAYFLAGTSLFSVIGFIIGGNVFILALILTLLFSYLLMKYSNKVIGGTTGDVFGAGSELTEILCLFIFLVVRL